MATSIRPTIDPAPAERHGMALTLTITVAALYFGSEVCVPIALAILLSFVLAPAVRLLHRWHLGRVLPVILVTTLAFLVIAGIGGLIATQLRDLASDFPRYQTTVERKVDALKQMAERAGLQRGLDLVRNVSHLSQNVESAQTASPTGTSPTEPQPTPVVIRSPAPSPLETATRILSPLLHPVTTLGVVVIFTIFILLQREDLRNRLIRLVGAGDLHRSTAAINDAARRLSRYLLAQSALNLMAGILVGAALWLLGVPGAVLWGVLFGCLRFVPYVGAPLAALPPILLAAAVDPGWSITLWTIGMFAVTEFVLGQIVEPFLYGHNTGLSPVAVVIAATFWTVLWGPIGLLLSTPITVCLVVLGRHVEQLKFLDVLLGDRPPLTGSELFYQRMLANDPMEAAEQGRTCLKTMSLVEYYDDVVLPGLLMAQDDVGQGRLDAERQARLASSVREVIEDLGGAEESEEERPRFAAGQRILAALTKRGETTEPEKQEEAEHAEVPIPPAWAAPGAILCIGARGPLDDAAALMTEQVLALAGFGTAHADHDRLLRSNIETLDLASPRLIILASLAPSSTTYLKFLIRRIRRKRSGARILVGAFWRAAETPDLRPAEQALAEPSVGRLADVVVHCLSLARSDESQGEAKEVPLAVVS